MVASRYQGSFGYAPRMASGAYPSGGPRNALAPVYSAPPVGSVGSPVGMPQAPAMQAPMGPAAPSLTSGTGALSGPPRMMTDGAGESAQGEYGGPGPTGAPSTGNFGEDAKNAAQNLGGFLGLAAMGPPGIAIGALSGLAAGALRGLGYEQTANALVSGVFGGPSMGGGDPVGTAFSGNATSGMPAGITDQQMFGWGATQAPTEVAAQTVESKDFGADAGGFTAEAPGAADGLGASKDSTMGDIGAGLDGGYGGDNGGASQGESAGNGTGDNAGDAKREGGFTRMDTDGYLDEVPIRAHENEYVVRPEATMHYGADIMHALNAGQIPRNVLAALTMQQRPQAANHLLQMMMR